MSEQRDNEDKEVYKGQLLLSLNKLETALEPNSEGNSQARDLLGSVRVFKKELESGRETHLESVGKLIMVILKRSEEIGIKLKD